MVFLVSGFGVSQAEIRFSNITDTCGIGNFHEAGFGVAIIDFNGDSLQDIFVVGQQGHNRLFQNNGNMEFVDMTSNLHIAGSGEGWGVCYGDFDSDYDEDIYISRRDAGRNQLFVFDNGTYADRAQQLHVDDPGGYGYSACFAPFTKSLCLDIISVNQAWSGHRQSCRFFAGSPGGVFTDISYYAGLADSSQYWDCASACNYDNDGDLDLLVSGESFNRLYNNNGHGFFSNFSDSAQINLPRDGDTTGYGITWGDYNNDGNMDYYITYWHDQNGEMFRNNGDGTFTDVTTSLGLGHEYWSHSVSFGDFNNDGWLDIYAVSASYGNKLYKNNRGTSFTDISVQAGVEDWGYCCGLGLGDLDGDGKLDMVVGHYANPSRMAYLYRNTTVNTNNWIEIKINGFPPNPDGIGARVRLFTGSIVQTREVSGGSGFGSQNMLPLHFGLGTATTVDSLIITYPNTRIAPIKYHNLSGNGYYELPDIVIDAAGVGVLQPQLQDYETPLYPEISFTNRGTVDLMQVKTACNLITNGVRQQIDSAYIQFFAQGDTTVVEYLDYSLPRCRQTYTLEGIITTNGDRQRQNDTVSTTFYAGYYHDLDCRFANISHPESLVINMPPRVVLTNVGITPESSIPVRCRIWLNDSLLYSEDYHYATTLSPLSRDTLLFPSFDPTGPGRYRVSVYSMLASDQDRSNDTSSYEIELGGSGCNYVIGDINNSGRANGVDIVYAVRYFKGGEAPPYICDCPTVGPLYVAGDVNGSCTFNGADITYMVNFFKGGATLTMCPYCMPGGMKR
jgi:hypothetical protein